MKFPSTDYLRASSVEDACRALARDGARIIAGGQSLLPLMAFRLSRPEVLVDVCRLDELRGISVEHLGDGTKELVIGAATTHAEIEKSPVVASALPCLAQAARNIGHPAIRHLGTIGGSIAHADPAAEWPALCIGLGAEVEIVSRIGSRREAVERLIAGPYLTTLKEDEIISRIRFALVARRRVALSEVARRSGDFALAGAVGVVDGDDSAVSVTLFGIEGRPRRVQLAAEADSAELADIGTNALEGAVLAQLGAVLEDANADAAFRRHLAVVVTSRALRDAYGQAHDGGNA